jgi:predicted MFS family arabinose efflux permease
LVAPSAVDLNLTTKEKQILFIVIAIQFINILEFMMVMPLGPDFAKDLAIDTSHLGVISGSYTAASALTGILSASYLERFDRKQAIVFALIGLVIATLIAGLSQNLTMLLGARILAGIFGGPSTSIALAIISDVVPPVRRGKALGAVMSSFAIASVFGVPLGLEAARLGGWRVPFFFISLLGILVIVGVFIRLPNFRHHLDTKHENTTSMLTMLRRPVVLYSLVTSSLLMSSGFMLIPNIAPYVQMNLHYPREDMGILYFVGGLASFGSMIIFGQITDRVGALPVGILGCAVFFLAVFFGFVEPPPMISVLLIFSLFMVASALRGVAFNTISSKIPGSHERARFMSVQSSVQHLSSALGAGLSSLVLTIGESQVTLHTGNAARVVGEMSAAQLAGAPNPEVLNGIDTLGWLAILLNFFMIGALILMQRALVKQEARSV